MIMSHRLPGAPGPGYHGPMDITALPDLWRDQALPSEHGQTLERCADELELAWHQHAHDGAFEPGCRFCDWEREHNDTYPEIPA